MACFLKLLQVSDAEAFVNSLAEIPDETSKPGFNIRAYRKSIKDSCVPANGMPAVVNVTALAYFISTLFDRKKKKSA